MWAHVYVCVCLTLDSAVEFCMSSCAVTAASIQTVHDVHSHTHSFPVHTSTISLPRLHHSFLSPSLNPSHSVSPSLSSCSSFQAPPPPSGQMYVMPSESTRENTTCSKQSSTQLPSYYFTAPFTANTSHILMNWLYNVIKQAELLVCPEDVTQSSAIESLT